MAETLILLISELVTNAVVHTGCPAVLRMLLPGSPADAADAGDGAGTVRVEVVDRSARPPAQRHAHGDDTNGRGLELVDGLADRWGWRPEGTGKSIWCEVDRCEPGVAAVAFEGTTHEAAAYDATGCDTVTCNAAAHDTAAYDTVGCDVTAHGVAPHGVTACDGAGAVYGGQTYGVYGVYGRTVYNRAAYGDVDVAYEAV